MSTKISQDIISFYSPYKNTMQEWKTIHFGREKFQIYEQYQLLNLIDQNANETFVVARDKMNRNSGKNLMTIKKIKNVFQHKIFARNTLRQIKLLRNLRHENVLHLRDIILPKSREQFQALYLICDLQTQNLRNFITQNDSINQEQLKFFLYQLIRGLKYIHSANVVHGDLKPRHLLINQEFQLKISNFKSARLLQKLNHQPEINQYDSSNVWYQAPQVLLGTGNHAPSSDMWSVGCIFAEMIKRKPFLQGFDSINQLQLIFQMFGVNQQHRILSLSGSNKKRFLQSPKKRSSKCLRQIFCQIDPQGVDLLQKFLNVDPEKRISAQQALNHPYLNDYHLEQDQPKCQNFPAKEFQFEDHNLTTEQLKDLIYQQILLHNNQDFQQKHKLKLEDGGSLISHVVNNSNKWRISEGADNDQ